MYNLAFKAARTEGEYVSSANAMIFAGDCAGAARECTEGLRRYPESAELYAVKARAYLLSGDTDKAIGTLDQGYKQTKSEELLEQRAKIAEAPAEDAAFAPLTPIEDSTDMFNTSSGSSGASSVEVERPPYVADTPIHVTIPNVTPPPTVES